MTKAFMNKMIVVGRKNNLPVANWIKENTNIRPSQTIVGFSFQIYLNDCHNYSNTITDI